MKQLVGFIFLWILLLIGCTTERQRTAMRQGLDSLNQRNRTDQPFTTKDVEPYVRFFDSHGTANDRLLAHYLLGRAYYEHGEAPMALECYHDAINCADTTANDCDFAQMSRAYGQMAKIHCDQGLYRQQLNLTKEAAAYAWKAHDTLSALLNYEQQSVVYRNLHVADSAIIVVEDVANMYLQYGYPSDAAIALGSIIHLLIKTGDYAKAKPYMVKYETESGLFNVQGDIVHGREYYYRVKGLYYLYNNILDSAEYYFRKELRDGKDFNNQHSGSLGLAELYQIRQQTDSTAKYYKYAYDMSDSLYSKRKTKDVERIQAMYNYTRQQAIALQESQSATRANIRFLISIVILLFVLLTASWLYIARRKVIESLEQTASELNEIREENNSLKHDTIANQQQIIENEKRIKHLEKKLGKYGKIVFFGSERMDNNLKQSPNYQQIEELAYKGLKLSEGDWDTVCNLASEYYPGFYDFLLSRLQIDSIDYHICLLLRLHFKTGEIANMLGVTPPYISKTSTDILGCLFGKKGSSKELSKELRKID